MLYNETYQHQIVCAASPTKDYAIAQALRAAKMLIVEKTNIEYVKDSKKLSQFMNAKLRDRTIYNLSFWDIGYTYELGQASNGDWLGVRFVSEFEYNP